MDLTATRQFVNANRTRWTVCGYGCYASRKHRYVYVAVGKGASTKIKADLHRLEGLERPEKLEPGQLHHREQEGFDFVPSLIDFDEDETVEAAPSDLLDNLSERLNPTVKIYHAAVYDRELADRVYQLYRSDFELYEYDRDSWLFDYEE